MKKVLLNLSICSAVVASSVNVALAAPITEQPEGTYYDNIYRSSKQYLTLYNTLYESNIEGKISYMVIDGNDFYLYSPVLNFSISQPYWLKGTLGADGEVVFKMPQEAYVQPANPYIEGSVETLITAKMFKAIAGEDGKTTFEPDEENTDLVMTWKDNKLTQIQPAGYTQVVGLVDEAGQFTGSAEGAIAWSVFTETPATAPAGLETAQYVCSSTNSWGEESKRIVEIGVSGNDMWIGNLYAYFPDSWIHGTVDGDKVHFASNQYLGIYTTEMYYYFFQAADTEPYINEWEEEGLRFVPADEVTLTKDGDSYAADCAMLMTFGMYTANPGMPAGSQLTDVTFTPYNEVPATPAAPEITMVGDYYDPWGRSVSFNIPMEDTEGNFINPDNMYYNVFINGEPYSLTPEIYPVLTSTITDIPYNFSETGVVFSNDGEEHTLTLYIKGDITVAVQSAYTVDGVTNKSQLVSSGLEDVVAGNSQVVATEWYNLSGVLVNKPATNGVFIRVERMADGSVKSDKVVR